MKNEFGNTNSKNIWKNELLCSQFLRGYSNVSIFENVQPEDIEDVTEKLRPFVGVEYERDAVKKVHLRSRTDSEGLSGSGLEDCSDRAVFVIALLDHKSEVDYDTPFQLLKYMVGIWALYRNEMDRKKSHSSSLKDFKYPLILPIIYYEGKDNWTATLHWRERVELSEEFSEFVPDFTYRVVKLHDYSNEQLLSHADEMSLIMVFNRVQGAEDLDISRWTEAQKNTAQQILDKAPDAVVQIIKQMVHHIALKMNLPDNEIDRCVQNVEDKKVGELFANMDKMDIQAERRNTKEAREALERANEIIKQLETERKQGELRVLVKLTCQKLVKGKCIQEIAEDLETAEDEIRQIYDVAKEYAPNYDVDAIVTKFFFG